MSYYYFAATLPSLQMDGALPFSFSSFKQLCQVHLSPAHALHVSTLESLKPEKTAHPFVRSWLEQEARIRHAVARHRAERRKLDPAAHLRQEMPHDSLTEKAVAEAFDTENPLARERALDEFRWQQLCERAGYDIFSLTSILAYGLKLRIVERWSNMNEANGRVRAEDIIEQRSKDSAGHAPNRTSKTERL